MSPHKGYMNIAIAAVLFAAAFAGIVFIADEDVVAEETQRDAASLIKVTFRWVDSDGATTTIEKPVGVDGNFTFPAPEEVFAGYAPAPNMVFAGWMTEAEGPVYKAGSLYALTNDITVSPKEVAAPSIAVLIYGDVRYECIKSTSDTVSVDDITKFAEKFNAKVVNGKIVLEGYYNSGWIDKDGKSVTNLTFPGAGETVEYTLDLVKQCKVSFFVEGVEILNTVSISDKGIKAAAPANPAKEHYAFVGWSDGADVYKPGADGNVDISKYNYVGDTTFTAVFEPNTYTVHFVVDGKTFAERSSKYGYQIDLPALPEGYKAWVGADGKVVSSPVTIVGETTFTAAPDVFYTITFVNGEEVIGTAKVLENTVIAPEQIPAVPEGCSGWDFDATVAITADATVKAVPYVYCTVVFDFGDKNFDNVSVRVISGQTVPADKVPAIPENFPKADQTWDFDIEAPVVADMTVKLRDIINYTVTFIAGEQTVATVSVPEKTVVAAPELPEGYKAWDFDFTAVITADTTVSAIAKETVFTVTFEIEGKAPVVQKSDSLVIPDPAVDGKVFRGWVVKGQTQYVDPSTYVIKEDVTFVAIYDEAEPVVPATTFNVTFMIEGKSPVTQKSDSITVPDTAREGYVFQGWVVQGSAAYVDPANFKYDADVTFVAIYKEAPAPAGPGFFETNQGKCVAVIIGVALLALIYAVYTNMFGMKDLLTSFKIQRVKKE